jgi:hypothetical protein
MASKKRTDAELIETLSAQLDDAVLSSDYPLEAVQKGLHEAGGDPDEIGRWGTELVAGLAKKRRLAWQAKAMRTRDMMQAKLAHRAVVAAMPRTELLRRIDEAKRSPHLTGPIALAARNLNEAASTDEALRELVEDIEALVLLTTKDPED